MWAADITYLPIGRGFLYLVAVIDWASRAVLAWRLSNTMDVSFCVAALEEALATYGTPEIFNPSSCCAADWDRSCGLAFAHVLALPPDTRVKSSGRLVQQLLLPGIDLVRVNLMALARSATVACSRTASSAIFAFNAASIFRRVFSSSCPPSIKRSGPFPTKPLVLKSGSISIMVAGTRSNGTRGDLFTDGPCHCDEPCPVEDVHVGRPTVRLARSPPPQCEARGFCHSLSNTRTTPFAAH